MTFAPGFHWVGEKLEDQEQSGREWLKGKRISKSSWNFRKMFVEWLSANASGEESGWSYTVPMVEETMGTKCYEIFPFSSSLLKRIPSCEKKALPVHLIKYLYNFQGDSWCNFRVFYRFPVLASTHFWRCVHWKHRPVLRMMGSCFRKHKKPGLETRRHSGCGTCKLCMCRDEGLEFLKDRKKNWKSARLVEDCLVSIHQIFTSNFNITNPSNQHFIFPSG